MAKKKGKKGKKKKEEPPPPEPSEFDDMTTEALREQIGDLRKKVERAQLDRNQVQLDRDTIQTFYDITKKEVDDTKLKIMAKDREMELMEDNHRVEVRVYIQKVKHLEYEHSNSLSRIKADDEGMLMDETDTHDGREIRLRATKRMLKQAEKEMDAEHAMVIAQRKMLHEKNLQKNREKFAATLASLQAKYEERLARLKDDLALRRKVEIHEIEERKNLHINSLLESHEIAFNDIKTYYNDITRDNLVLIKDFKDQVIDKKKKAEANKKLMLDIAAENTELSKPLKIALAEVKSLEADLRDAEKDRMSLRNARARLVVMEAELRRIAGDTKGLEGKFADVQVERDELYTQFESTVKEVKSRAEFKNLYLEKKLDEVEGDLDVKSSQIREVLGAANLDHSVLLTIGEHVDSVLDSRNSFIRELQFNLARVTKAHNDVLRVYESKLRDMGVAVEETGFVPLTTTTSLGPAGLVSAPTV